MSTWFRRTRATWTDEERSEYDDTMVRAWADSRVSPEERIDILLDGIADADQARRVWSRDTRRQAERRGAWLLLRSWKQAQPRPLEINWKGEIHLKSPVIGVKERTPEGAFVDQQVLVHFATFDQLRDKLPKYLQQIKAYELDIHLMVKLLALQDEVEGADGSWTPAKACEALGVTVQEYIGIDLAA